MPTAAVAVAATAAATATTATATTATSTWCEWDAQFKHAFPELPLVNLAVAVLTEKEREGREGCQSSDITLCHCLLGSSL